MWRANFHRFCCVSVIFVLATLTGCTSGYDPRRDARLAVEQWIDAFNLALTANDASRLESLSGPDCGFCWALRDEAKSRIARGSHVEGGTIDAGSVKVSDLACAAEGPCGGDGIVLIWQSAGHEVAQDGSRQPVIAESEATLYFEVSRASGRWQVTHAEVFPLPHRQ